MIRGCKPVATLAPYANEFLGLAARPGYGMEEVIYFGIPINTKGVHVICRQPLAPADPTDHPLSGSWDEMDASIIFDDVFIPEERVFYLRKVTPDNGLFCSSSLAGSSRGPSITLRFARP